MLLTCPCCHARNSIEAFSQDDACRELFRHCGQLPDGFWRVLVSYLGLFRSESRALAWDRALKLTTSLLDLNASPATLMAAMQTTVEALRFKPGKALKDHNYLKRVLETISATGQVVSQERVVDKKPQSKSAIAIDALMQWAGNDWLRQEIANGLQALIAQNLKKQPAAEIITLNADIWHQVLSKICNIEEIDAPRIRKAFERLFEKLEEWPAPKLLVEQLPPRPVRQVLPQPIQEADTAFVKEKVGQFFKGLAAKERGGKPEAIGDLVANLSHPSDKSDQSDPSEASP